MTKPARTFLATALAAVGSILLLFFSEVSPPLPVRAGVLETRGPLTWYRGNIHTHSLWSDGDDYPEMIAAWYKEHGYQFLCFTDHNVLPNTKRWTDVEKNKGGLPAYEKLTQRFPDDWIDERIIDGKREVRLKTLPEVAARLGISGKFLLIQGEEISDAFGKLPLHLNATNLQELIPPMRGESVYDTIQNNVNAVIAQRERTGKPILVHLNHPNFGFAVTAEDLMRVRGENFFEVYNGHPAVHNEGNETHASADRIWDIVLATRLALLDLPMMYGLAVDDGHAYHGIPNRQSNPGRGWVMVLAEKLSPEGLIAALEAGRFYASTGVSLDKVVSSEKGLQVVVKAEPGVEYTIEFVGTRRGFDPEGKPVLNDAGEPVRATLRYSEAIGEVFATVPGTEAGYTFRGDELYVRARITSSRPHPNPSSPGEFERAWCQPVRGPAARESD